MTGIARRVSCPWVAALLGAFALLISFRASAGPPDAEVLPPGIAVRQGPALTAPILAELPAGTPMEVLLTQRGPGGDWAQVVLPAGGTGFVPAQGLRRLSPAPQWRSYGSASAAQGIARRIGPGVVEVPLRRAGGTFLVAARINNQATTSLVVDTGAATVMVSHALAAQLGLDYTRTPKVSLATPSGLMSSHRVVLESVAVPDQWGAGVAGVAAVVATLPGAPREIGGLLGQSFLRHFRATIDAERRILHLEAAR
ncbi:MAG TPA: aspartyl protease family protein [Candidatus Methylomirabilis sp.]|jgi:clan AA aspartic protease (TIGR02281 family)